MNQPWYLRVFLRFIESLYRVTVVHTERIPASGGALLVSNHLSAIDMLLILSTTKRHIRFLLPEEDCERPLLRPLLKLFRVIPLPSGKDEKKLSDVLSRAADAIQGGELVGLFPELNISRLGVILPFHQDFNRIVSFLNAPVVPVCIDGIWGSIFSCCGKGFLCKKPQPVSVSFGAPLPPDSTEAQVTSAIRELNTEAWRCRRPQMKPLGRAFVQAARRSPFKFLMADATVPRLSMQGALVRALVLARRLSKRCATEKMVGVLLPPSVGAALVNLALLVAGKVPVNLNYTLASDALEACSRECDLKTVLTSRKFLQRLKVEPPAGSVLLEDLIANTRRSEKLAALVLAWVAPIPLLEKSLGCAAPATLDDLGTVIFSSGSTGEPKGIMLSHYNLCSNAQQLCQTFNFFPNTKFIGVLPLFHSFGFTATLVLPATCGIGVVYHPDPRDGKAVGELVRKYGIDCLMATPSFLGIYLAKVEAAQFGSLRIVLAGAEKMSGALATEFEERFGVKPMEGYGCTECAPAVAVNTLDFRAAGLRQVGNRRGSIGRPLPGISVRIVDSETGADLPIDKPGLLLVRGPNVMRGYLNRPDKTDAVLVNGWYQTGDIAAIDAEGFVHITDRLSRFSKIGGEMVPHMKIEEKLHDAAHVSRQTFVVTAIPDETKGERLVVLHTLDQAALAAVLKELPRLGLPNLWTPKPNQFYAITDIPMTGTGKLALQQVRKIALGFAKTTSQKRDVECPEDVAVP